MKINYLRKNYEVPYTICTLWVIINGQKCVKQWKFHPPSPECLDRKLTCISDTCGKITLVLGFRLFSRTQTYKSNKSNALFFISIHNLKPFMFVFSNWTCSKGYVFTWVQNATQMSVWAERQAGNQTSYSHTILRVRLYSYFTSTFTRSRDSSVGRAEDCSGSHWNP